MSANVTAHWFCANCGSAMREILHPNPRFDRETGEQGQSGTLYWECPKRGIGMDAYHGEWMRDYELNPHDSVFIGEAPIPTKPVVAGPPSVKVKGWW